MQNKPRRTSYTDTEFKDMVRQVSTTDIRIYFTDVDFIGYVYENQQPVYKIAMEAKRRYQVVEGVYRLVNSDKAVINLARKIGIPLIFVFYDERKLSDTDNITVAHVDSIVDAINVQEYRALNKAKDTTVGKLKAFLRQIATGAQFVVAWSAL